MQNIIRIRCLICIDNKTEKVWKELQVPIVNDPNVHVPESIQSSGTSV
jgi:hypothetical protein